MHQLAPLLSLLAGTAVVDATWLRWTGGDKDAPWLPAMQTAGGKDPHCRPGVTAPNFSAPTPTSAPEAVLELRQAGTTAYVNSKTCGWYGTDSCRGFRHPSQFQMRGRLTVLGSVGHEVLLFRDVCDATRRRRLHQRRQHGDGVLHRVLRPEGLTTRAVR